MWLLTKHLRTLSGTSDADHAAALQSLDSPIASNNNNNNSNNGSGSGDHSHNMTMEIDHDHCDGGGGVAQQQCALPLFDNFHELPDEVILNIFQFLSRRNIILQVERVNRHFNQLAKDEFLWWNLTFGKSSRRSNQSQVLDPTVRLFERNPGRELFVKYKLNCRNYYMEKLLVKRSCDTRRNVMDAAIYVPTAKLLNQVNQANQANGGGGGGGGNYGHSSVVHPASPTSPFSPQQRNNRFDFSPNSPIVNSSSSGESSPVATYMRRKLQSAAQSIGLVSGGANNGSGSGSSSSSSNSLDTNTLFGHDQSYERRMKLAQEQSTRMGHYSPHARHRHTITCTTPDESSFVMIGGFKNANHAVPVVQHNPPAPLAPLAQQQQQQQQQPLTLEVEDSDVLHEFNTRNAHFSQVRIQTPTTPLTPNTISNQFSFQPLSPLTPNTNAALFNASVNTQWMTSNNNHSHNHSQHGNNGSRTPTTPHTPLTPLSARSTGSVGGGGSHIRTNSLSGKPMQFGKHSCVCVDNKRLLLFGGTEGENTVVTNNLYTYDLETKEWTQIEFEPDAVQPSARTNHQAALVIGPNGRREMYIVGGGIGQQMTPTDEIWALDIEEYTWRLVPFNLKPGQKTCPFTPRLGFTLHEVNNKLILYGGGYWYQNGTEKKWKEYYRELFVFDVKTSVWTNIDMTDCIDHVPRSGTFPVSCRVGAQLFVVGGGIVWDVSSEINVLDLVTFKWRKLSSEQAYAADSSACIALKDYSDQSGVPKTKILLFGGYRYKPLSEYKVFAVRWKDFMTERGLDSLTKLDPVPSSS